MTREITTATGTATTENMAFTLKCLFTHKRVRACLKKMMQENQCSFSFKTMPNPNPNPKQETLNPKPYSYYP